MARKRNQHRNGTDHTMKHKFSSPAGKKEKPNDKISGGEDIPNCDSPLRNSTKKKSSGVCMNNNEIPVNICNRDNPEEGVLYPKSESISSKNSSNNHLPNSSELREVEEVLLGTEHSSESLASAILKELKFKNMLDGFRFSCSLATRNIGVFSIYVMRMLNEWFELMKPQIAAVTTFLCDVRNYISIKIKLAYPIIWTWIFHFGKIAFLLSMVWLDCSLRGFNSLIHLGTTSFFAVVWCSILSLFMMVGLIKMLIILVIAVLFAIFVSFALAICITAIVATIILYIYGSFWMTSLIITLAGVAFCLRHEQIALCLATLYSVYCARYYVGWLGLLLGLNLSFVSSDVLINFSKKYENEPMANSSPEQDAQPQSRAGRFFSHSMNNQPTDDAFHSTYRRAADSTDGSPSTSGNEVELTSEEEVIRLLNCGDHYSALGFARFANIDLSILKKEYRKKAMMVHPDKNMGNDKAAEAFKKLQNAYEVLLDTFKRKTYDDELRREELLNYFRRLQASPQSGRHGGFSPSFGCCDGEDEASCGESRKIACKKCSGYHIWTCTNRTKSRARWCQDCKDFHQAKDGDGWVEQSFEPVLFGLLHKRDPPRAYICAESRIYDATQWFVCQGMRCPVNTHKASFQVNTSLTSKCNTKGAGSSSGYFGGIPMPNANDVTTEEAFFEWLQNAMQSGVFDVSNMQGEGPGAKCGNFAKSNSGGKKKRKGKKQW